MSTRHLSRLFHDELSTTPARYVESIRFDLARALLDQGHNATQAATRAGFPSYERALIELERQTVGVD
ncbi:helix-turn-helix domain-containing protein [Micromonospora sp. NPDC005305]|uniref:helix-turn-helix domain-containing protein n=1 Tax=Micromonospora sp. NPDC005305 TaxID=3156875 RepID=UPI0033BDA258